MIPFILKWLSIKVIQGMFDRLSEIGRRYGMEMNVEETKVMRISR
jgi:hypothetical protein